MLYDKTEPDGNESSENRIIYSLPTRLGLWQEELAQKEEKLCITAYKRKLGQLLIQKLKRMLENLLQPTVLAIKETYVMFGKNYQIKTLDLPLNLKHIGSSNILYLSGLITEREIDSFQQLNNGCMLTASTIEEPYVRNTFRIVPCKGKKDGERVLCGEDVLIQIANADLPLYIQCESQRIDTVGYGLSLKLCQTPDVYCRFKVIHWNPQMRTKTSGKAFTPNSKNIIQQSASGQNLAVHCNEWIPTFFGPECMVSCRTYKDSHKMETAENFWVFADES
ncbi:cilia- and flagella-associated protein 161 [Cylas formicarius]|uniref:cilia- and flagella-associated protein 161 n=1 Tax=Cylas formicarius TaxID=197179 RepID=UPI0029588A54|nr:cilia- and flagella-associated protein 161 [Cylas formicarius]